MCDIYWLSSEILDLILVHGIQVLKRKKLSRFQKWQVNGNEYSFTFETNLDRIWQKNLLDLDWIVYNDIEGDEMRTTQW